LDDELDERSGTMLLARMAEAVYWAGRHLERAEGTARIVQVHTDAHVDLQIGEVGEVGECAVALPRRRDGDAVAPS